jgi:hypothetical protein
LGYGFEYCYAQDDTLKKEKIFSYQGEEIGKQRCQSYDIDITDQYIALDPKGYKGVVVWNNITREWTRIEFKMVGDIIGWQSVQDQ